MPSSKASLKVVAGTEHDKLGAVRCGHCDEMIEGVTYCEVRLEAGRLPQVRMTVEGTVDWHIQKHARPVEHPVLGGKRIVTFEDE